MGDDKHRVQSPEGEAKIGAELEKARLERGLSLEEVEQATKIRKRYLSGLEREDYSVMPDGVYAQGFLKTYANYLGLDGEELSQRLKDSRRPRRERGISYNVPKASGFERPLISPGGLAGTEKRSVSTATILGIVVAVLAVAAVIGGLYYVGRGAQISGLDERDASPVSSEKAPDNPDKNRAGDPGSVVSGKEDPQAGEEPAPNGEPGAAAEPDTLTVAVSVEERPSWLSVVTDGSVALEQLAEPGFSQTFEADQALSIRTGDAGAVSVEVNGQEVGPLGESGEVLTKTWTVKAAS
jgi:cytoskeleton protein RodZ